MNNQEPEKTLRGLSDVPKEDGDAKERIFNSLLSDAFYEIFDEMLKNGQRITPEMKKAFMQFRGILGKSILSKSSFLDNVGVMAVGESKELFSGSISDILSAALETSGMLACFVSFMNGWDLATNKYCSDNVYVVPGKLALLHSEVSEALEAYRKGDIKEFNFELADIFIRLVELASSLDVNLARYVLEKMGKNMARGFRHGGKVV